MSDCYPCVQNGLPPSSLPPRERIYDDGLWRVAHAFNSALPGWMVVVPRRHITSLSELTSAEARVLGPLLRSLSQALERALGAQKAYMLFLAEGEGFHHVHIHVVPRQPDQPAERRGARIFGYLDQPPADWVSPAKMDRIADELRPLLAACLEGDNSPSLL